MMNKIVKSLNSINSFSKKIIIGGCSVSLLLCITGIILVFYNNIVNKQVELFNVGSSMISTAGTLFAYMVIGALIIDFFGKFVDNGGD